MTVAIVRKLLALVDSTRTVRSSESPTCYWDRDERPLYPLRGSVTVDPQHSFVLVSTCDDSKLRFLGLNVMVLQERYTLGFKTDDFCNVREVVTFTTGLMRSLLAPQLLLDPHNKPL